MTVPVMLRVEDVADWIGCSPRTVQRMIRAGTLGSVRIGGMRRVPRREVERLIGGAVRLDEDAGEPHEGCD